ncbi:MAG TPA: selenium metabolism-associated LysR family transcriptional regulator [Thermodesulfobacteriota bacterium]|nr:selenium metabolism-associated LysR family transcriptional regulator [Thermodesulfobacteriota bacterium]
MKLNQLEIFCKIAELGSFSRAASKLHLSQPTLTEHMKSLEASLGIPLLDRLGREVVPTKAGELLKDYALRMLELKEEAEQKLASFQGELKGTISVGASTIPGEFILPGLLPLFRKAFPHIHLDVMISDTRGIVDHLLAHRIELGLVGAQQESDKLEFHRFAGDELIVALPMNSPWAKHPVISLEELRQIPLVLREEGSGTLLALEKALKRKTLDSSMLTVIARLGSTTAVLQAIKHGAAGSILSRRAVQEELERGAIRAILVKGLRMRREFYVVVRRGRSRSPLCAAFFTFLLSQAHPHA